MYKFTNGVVVFTEEDKENYIKAGYVLVEEKKEKVVEKEDSNEVVGREPRRSTTTDRNVLKSRKQRNR